MKKRNILLVALSTPVLALLLGGCSCGASFSEWWYEKNTDDPSSVGIVLPNDTIIDPMADHVQEKSNDWNITASVVPAEEAEASLASIGTNRYGAEKTRQFFVALGQDVANRFGALKNFKLVGSPAADPSGITEVHTSAPNRLTYNLTQLSSKYTQGKYHDAVWVNGHKIADSYRDPDYYTATAGVQVALIDDTGNQRFSINAVVSANADTAENASSMAIKAAVNDVMYQYGMRYAPPGHVTMMRGDGLFAKINIGQNDGVTLGMPVRFIQYVSIGKLGNQDNIQENIIAIGNVVKIEGESSWVKINCYHHKVVHIGCLVKLGN